jgi:transcriptional regulator with XRE-family HTH domain
VAVYLQDWRVRQGFTLKQAGDAVGRHLSSIQKWENGGTSPTLREVELLAQAYGIHPATFFFHPDGTDIENEAKAIRMWAKISDAEPAAMFLADGNSTRAKELTVCLHVLECVPADFVFHWLEMAKALIVSKVKRYKRPKTDPSRRMRRC